MSTGKKKTKTIHSQASRGGAAAMLATWALAAGCSPPRSPLHLYAGIDTSEGARSHRGEYAALIAQVSETLRPEVDRLTIYRVDRTAKEIEDGAASGDAELTLKQIAAEARHAATGGETRPEAFYRAVADRIEGSSGSAEEAVVLFATDGDNDDQSAASAAALRVDAARLARSGTVRAVIVCGVEAGNRAALRAVLRPLGNRRLSILGPGEIRPAAVEPLIDQAPPLRKPPL